MFVYKEKKMKKEKRQKVVTIVLYLTVAMFILGIILQAIAR